MWDDHYAGRPVNDLDPLISPERVYPDIEANLPNTTSNWPIDRALARLLARMVIERRLRDILEFGAGSSSIVFAQALRHLAGGRLTSVEEEPAWSTAQWKIVASTPGVDARMIQSRVSFRATSFGLYRGYSDAARAVVAARAPYDLVLIDGPDGYVGRDGALHLAFPFLASGALIVVDDSGRRKERDAIARWLAIYPGLRVLADMPSLGRGTTVLHFTGDRTRRTSARAFVSSAVREAYAWMRHLTHRAPRPPSSE